MRLKAISLAVLTAAALAAWLPVAALAQETGDIKGRVTFGIKPGFDLELSGNVHEGGTGTVLGLPTTVEARSFSDIYNTPPHAELSLGYGFWDMGELLAVFTYRKATAEEIQVGDVAGLPLLALFDDWTEAGLRLGYRHYFALGRLRPYGTISGGFKVVSSIGTIAARLSVPDAGVVLEDIDFYDNSVVLSLAAKLGFMYGLGPGVFIGVERGLQTQTSPQEIEGLAGTGRAERCREPAGRSADGGADVPVLSRPA